MQVVARRASIRHGHTGRPAQLLQGEGVLDRFSSFRTCGINEVAVQVRECVSDTVVCQVMQLRGICGTRFPPNRHKLIERNGK
jgi:hypothetical protein